MATAEKQKEECTFPPFSSAALRAFIACLTLLLNQAIFAMPASQAPARLQPVQLRCEYRLDPLGIDTPEPRLSWMLQSELRNQRQSAYRILVARSVDALNKETGDLWDSGKITGSQSIHIEYKGSPLPSGLRCHWRVKVWDKEDRPSDWSEPAWWEMGLLKPQDWQGQWITDGRADPEKDEDFYADDPAPLFRKTFNADQPIRRARLYITGVGCYAVRLNGLPASDHALDPAWTDYSKRIFYSACDVAGQLRPGTNCLAVTLGNGWYNPLPLRMWGHLNLRDHLPAGRPRFIARLDIEYENGSAQTILTDTSWKVTQGPLLRNNLYLGEVYDARKEIDRWDQPELDDSAWPSAAVAEAPGGRLQARPLPAIEPVARIKTVGLSKPDDGVYIFDMGRNFTGTIRAALSAPEGTRIQFRYGELLDKNGRLNPMTGVCGQIKGTTKTETGQTVSVGGPGAPQIAVQQDTYIARGRGTEIYSPAFTFHAFRYVELTGYPGTPTPEMIEGIQLRSAIAETGTFACSNDLFNRIQQMCVRTFESNIMGVQSDCPHRERFGYGGDIVATCDAFMLNYDMSSFYPKVVWDMHDAARGDGMLTDTAPFVGIQYCGVGWAMAHPLLQQQVYRYYGNERLIEQQYAVSKKWFDLVLSKTPDLVVTEGLSDHESLVETPAPPLVTVLFCQSARLLASLAAVLEKENDARHYAALADRIEQAWRDRFFEPQTGRCAPGTQAGQAFALFSDMLPEENRALALQRLIEDLTVTNAGKLTTGIFGTRYMLDVLTQEGRSDLVYELVNRREFPGWGFMLENGATTLWEHWQLSENTYSHNHPMFGSVSQWFFSGLAGIQPAADAVGFDKIALRPQFIDDLDWVRCTVNSIRGPIACNWQRENNTIHISIHIPANTAATLLLPVDSPDKIKENNRPVTETPGIEFIKSQKGALCRMGSGIYEFVIPDPKKE